MTATIMLRAIAELLEFKSESWYALNASTGSVVGVVAASRYGTSNELNENAKTSKDEANRLGSTAGRIT